MKIDFFISGARNLFSSIYTQDAHEKKIFFLIEYLFVRLLSEADNYSGYNQGGGKHDRGKKGLHSEALEPLRQR